VSPLRPEVTAAFRAFSEPLEGCVHHIYLDVRGLATTGIGCLIDPLPLALALPWTRGDGGELAEAHEVTAEWRRVHALPAGRVASYYAGPLRLPDAAIDALLHERLDAAARVLERHYPDLGAWPAQAQLATCSMAWALGASFAPRWPRFSAAARARDWQTCAVECAISTVGNPGVAPRNEANRALLLAAVGA